MAEVVQINGQDFVVLRDDSGDVRAVVPVNGRLQPIGDAVPAIAPAVTATAEARAAPVELDDLIPDTLAAHPDGGDAVLVNDSPAPSGIPSGTEAPAPLAGAGQSTTGASATASASPVEPAATVAPASVVGRLFRQKADEDETGAPIERGIELVIGTDTIDLGGAGRRQVLVTIPLQGNERRWFPNDLEPVT